MTLSRITLGTWKLMETNTSNDIERLIRIAYDNGITSIDTAQVYGQGKLERIIGEVKKDLHNLTIATKIPGNMIPNKNTPLKDVYTPEDVEHKTYISLKNLDVDYIDIIQLHNWSNLWAKDEIEPIFEKLIGLKDRGIIKAIGVSLPNWVDESEVLLNSGFIDYLQVPYNLFKQDNMELLIKPAKINRIKILVRDIFKSGAFFGKGRDIETYERFLEVLIRNSLSYEESIIYAFHLCYSNPYVDSVIVGMNSEHTVKSTLEYRKNQIDFSRLSKICEAFRM